MTNHKRQDIDCVFQFVEDLDGSIDIAAYSDCDSGDGIDMCRLGEEVYFGS
jgi:hypothetical protein